MGRRGAIDGWPGRVSAIGVAIALIGGALTAGCGDRHWRYPKADVVLVVIDTLRADGLSSYGNPRRTTPNLDRLAAEGVQFDVVFAPAPQTGPSHASLFTGLYPGTHRVANLVRSDGRAAGLPQAAETLAERFRAAGYETAAFTDGAVLGRDYGLDQGFETFDGRFEGVARKVDKALSFLRARERTRPLFLFVHTYQVHQPYVAPREWVERFDPDYDGPLRAVEEEVRRVSDLARAGASEAHDFPESRMLLENVAHFSDRDVRYLRTMYDAAIAYTDDQLNRLWQYLEEGRRLDNTILVVTSDHGEAFNEHGHIGHRDLFRETLQVPLIMRLPGGADRRGQGVRLETPVALIDLHGTLLEAAGLGSGETGMVDLIEAVRLGTVAELPIFAETTDHFYQRADEHVRWDAIRSGRYERLRRREATGSASFLYDAVEDPGEQRPLGEMPDQRRLATALDEQLDAHAVETAVARRTVLGDDPALTVVPDEKTLRDLRSLGYVR